MRNSFWNDAAMLSTQVLLTLLLFSLVISVVVMIVHPHVRKYKPTDLKIFQQLQKLVNPVNNRFMLFITYLGKHQFLIPANLILIFYFLFINKHTWVSIRVLAIALSSLVLMLFLKKLFQRKRPLAPLLAAARGLSFPSGHAIMAVTFYGLIIYIITQVIGISWLQVSLIILLIILILLIGFSRVYLRVHYASDVLAGFIIGLLWLFISLAVLDNIEHYFISRPVFIPDHAYIASVARYFDSYSIFN